MCGSSAKSQCDNGVWGQCQIKSVSARFVPPSGFGEDSAPPSSIGIVFRHLC